MHHIFTRTIADVHGGRERPEPKVAGRRERQRGSRELWKFLLLMFPLAPVGRGPCGFLPRVPLRLRLRLPWARLLMPLWGVLEKPMWACENCII